MKKKILAITAVLGLIGLSTYFITKNNYHEKRIARRTAAATHYTEIISNHQEKRSEYENTQQKITKQQTRESKLDLIARELANRLDDIESLAEQLSKTNECPRDRNIIFDSLYNIANDLEARLMQSENLDQELHKIIADNLDIGNTTNSLAYKMAEAMHYGKCVEADGEELVTRYRHYIQAIKERRCEDAESIIREIGDAYNILQTIRLCKGIEEFYKVVNTLNDNDLIISARNIQDNEYERWRIVCETSRMNNGMQNIKAFSSCTADLLSEQGKILGYIPQPIDVGISSDGVRDLIRHLPRDRRRRERICAFTASVQQERIYTDRINISETVVTSEEAFNVCMGRKQ